MSAPRPSCRAHHIGGSHARGSSRVAAVMLLLLGACSERETLGGDGGLTALRDASAVDGGLAPDAGGEVDAGALVVDDAGAVEARCTGLCIAFNSKRDGNQHDLYVMSADGARTWRLTTDPGADVFPSWAPDGGKIAFASDRAGPYGLYVLDLATDTATAIATSLGAATSPAFSPDGASIAFEGRATQADPHEVYVVPASGGPAVNLTSHPARDAGPVWAPGGDRIYFVSDRSGRFEVWSMRADGTDPRAVTTGSRILGKPAVSPDGRTLAYARQVEGDQRSEIVLFELQSRQARALTSGDDSEPSFSPDGRELVFTTTRFGGADLMKMDAGGASPAVRLTDDPAIDSAPAFSPTR